MTTSRVLTALAATATAALAVLAPSAADADDDWLLDLVVRDRTGEDVAWMSVHGVESRAKGAATFSVCRAAVAAGRFTVHGVLTDRDGYDQTEHAVDGDRFWLTRR